MAVYCFICPKCNLGVEQASREAPFCSGCDTQTKRNFKAELDSQYIFIPIHMQGRVDVRRDDILPTAKDYESPEDPTGEKGFKEFKDSVRPKHKGAWV